jgi:uncharacterized repeat protein (TIGR02543 family)
MKVLSKQRIRKSVAVVMTAALLLTALPSLAFASEQAPSPKAVLTNETADNAAQQVDEALGRALTYMKTAIPAPSFGVIGGEWAVLSLARGGASVPAGYYEKYISTIVAALKSDKYNEGTEYEDPKEVGILPDSERKKTEYDRVIVGLTSIGVDVRNVGGYNLLEPLASFYDVAYQGINGPIWALIAFDTRNWDIPVLPDSEKEDQVTRARLISEILRREKDGGGWAFSASQATAGVDITGMALQALAPYYRTEREDIDADLQGAINNAVDRAITKLSEMQAQNGDFSLGESFGSGSGASSESVVQVVVALASLGIDAAADERFVKSGGNAVTALLAYQLPNGSFVHSFDIEGENQMSTEQATYALAAYSRFMHNENRLYDMTDVTPAPPYTEPDPSYTVTFNAANGTKNTSVSVQSGGALKKPAGPKRAGYIFAGWYAGTKKVDFASYSVTANVTLTAKWTKVSVAKVKGVKTAKPGKTSVTLSWKKVSDANGYVIQYSGDKKKLSKGKVVYVSAKSLKYVVKKLKKNKNYYFRVAAYKLDSTGKKVLGGYSASTSAKTKKK